MTYLILRFSCFNEKSLNTGVLCAFNNLPAPNISTVSIFCIDKKIILKSIVTFNSGALLGQKIKKIATRVGDEQSLQEGKIFDLPLN